MRFKKMLSTFLATTLMLSTIVGIKTEKAYASTQVWNYDYTGNYQTFTAPYSGRYKLEVWGAQGGINGFSGNGGYSYGEINVTGGQTIYVYVGGQGSVSPSTFSSKGAGGWNGGGDGLALSQGYVGGGGGATDIRTSLNDLNSRVIVAGGGGGGANSSGGNGGAGGGINGINGTSVDSTYGIYGKGGSQTSGGIGQYGAYATSGAGSFGQGGSVTLVNSNACGAGGGGAGWYGGSSGGATTPHSSGYSGGGGGGSGYIGGVSNGNTIAGNTSFTSPTGTTETGHSGNGYARITQLDIPPTLTISSPTANSQYAPGTNMPLTGTIADPDGLSSYTMNVNYNIDGGSTITLTNITDTTASTPFNYNVFLPSNLTIGNHTINVWSSDSQGAGGAIQSITINILDIVKPTLTISQNPTAWTNGNITLTATGSDNVGVTKIQTPDGNYTNASTATYTVSANGTYSFTAYDSAGNNITQSIIVGNSDKVIPTSPVISASKTGWVNANNITFTINSGTDANSGVNRTEWYIDGTGGNSWTTYSGQVSTSSLSLSDGTHNIHARTIDNAGNISAEATVSTFYLDRVNPSLALSPSTTSWTNGNVVVTATGSDALAGVAKIQTPDGTWVTGASTTYTITSNGTYSFVVQDNAGNQITQNSTISNIDKTAPALTLTPSTTSWTGGSITITASATDSQSGVQKIQLPNGNWVAGSSTTYVVTTNGNYTFNVVDNVGNTSTQTITIGNQDNAIPSLSVTKDVTAWTNGNVVLTATASDSESGIAKIQKHDGTWVIGGSATYTATANGNYTFIAQDNVGNQATQVVSITNIDKANPTVVLTPSTTVWTNGSISISATGSDVGSGVAKIQTPDGNWTNGSSASYSVSANGTYTFIIQDNVGNQSSQSITINNIDKTSPSLSISPSSTAWTNGSISLTASASDSQSGVKQIQKPDMTSVTGTTATYSVNANGTYSFVATDNVGNQNTQSITVSNIDVTAPSLTLTPSTTAWTSGTVTITASATDVQSGVQKIQKPDSTWATGNSATFTVSVNGTYSFTVVDNVGNQYTQSITINNIDKTSPTLALSPSTTNWTSGNITITAGATDSQSGIAKIQTPDGNWVTGASASYIVSANGTYVFNAMDSVGNTISQSITINNIDKTLPTASHTVSTSSWIKGNVVINLTASDTQSGIKRIQLPDGSYTVGATATYTATNNGTYTFQVEDNVGNILSYPVTISAIDITAPTLNLTPNSSNWNGSTITITATATDSQSGVKRIQSPDGIWNNGSTVSYTVNTNGTYNFIAEDNVGNQITKSITIGNIDKTAPVLNIDSSNTSWTNGTVILTATASDAQSGIAKIQTPDGNWTNSSTVDYAVNSNGTYTFVVVDNVGNQTTKSISVNNIDTTPPTAPTVTNNSNWTNANSVPVTIVGGTDGQSGVSKTEYKLEGATAQNWTTYSGSFNITNEGITTITVRTVDNLGQVSTQVVSYVKIDRTSPYNATIEIQLEN